MKKIYVTEPLIPNYNDYCNEIKDIWDNKIMTNNGIKHQNFENNLKEYLKVDNVVLTCNGHMSLEIAIQAFGLKGEIITTPFTFVSTSNAIIRSNCTPVFCDINKNNYTIDADKIESLITEKTVAIMPVHVFGNVCDVEKIEKIAKKYNLYVIYDAAHSFGVTYKNESILRYGDASILSFHATKCFNSIEGGAIVFKDNNLKEKFNLYKNFGILDAEHVRVIGTNAKMNEFQASMGICNLKIIDEEIENRKTRYQYYIDKLKTLKDIEIYQFNSDIETNYSYLPILVGGREGLRNELHEYLKLNNIISRKYFFPLLTDLEAFKIMNYDSNLTPVAQKVSASILTLPIYGNLEFKDIDRICDLVSNFYKINNKGRVLND